MAATDADLIQRARDLAPLIRSRSAEASALRRPHDETIAALADAEILQMLVPKRWGGPEARLSTVMEVVEIIAAACPSVGWIASFYIGHNIYVLKFPEAAQEELMAPRGYVLMPAASAPNLSAQKVEGGWRVSGRAAWGSGIAQADWVMLSGKTDEGPRSFLIPMAEITMIDVWHFAGMAGTGSNDYEARDVFVPEHRSLSGIEFYAGTTPGSQLYDNPLYSIPFLMAAYCTILPVLTGSLKGAMAAYEAIVEKRVRNFSGAVLKDQQHAHVALGEFEIATRIAGDIARQTYARTEQLLHERPFVMEDRLRSKGDAAFVSKLCRDTANAMMASAGASSYHVDQPLQRIWRDINTVCSHAFWDWDVTRELVGRHQLGLPVQHPLL